MVRYGFELWDYLVSDTLASINVWFIVCGKIWFWNFKVIGLNPDQDYNLFDYIKVHIKRSRMGLNIAYYLLNNEERCY